MPGTPSEDAPAASPPQNKWDHTIAIAVAGYLVAALAFSAWQMFDIWGEKYIFLQRFLLRDILGVSKENTIASDRLRDGVFRSMAYAAVGGAMGGAVNGMRSMLGRYVESLNPAKAYTFRARTAYLYFFLPPLGATLGLVVVALAQTSAGILSGDASISPGTGPSLSSFTIGFLAGYGSGLVFVWLDSRVAAVFKPTSISVPPLLGLSREGAAAALAQNRLNLGNVDTRTGSATEADKVVDQNPRAFSMVAEGSLVKITLGLPPPAVAEAAQPTNTANTADNTAEESVVPETK